MSDKKNGTATLLLADDSQAIHRIIELTFADQDVRVVVVGDGDAAIARIEEQPPDIVLADVGLPGKSGYEVARYIRHAPHLSHIPVLLLHGAFEPVDEHQATAAGCDGVLSKPFEPQLVVGRVNELLGRLRGEVSGGELAAPPPLSAPEPGHAELSLAVNADGDSAATESLGDFFDKLDAAFANLSPPRREMSALGDEEADALWISESPSGSDTDLPSFLTPSSDAGRLPPLRPVLRPLTGPSTPPSSKSGQHAMPPVSEASAALVAAGQPGTEPSTADRWARPSIEMDDLVERVAQRVLERLSDRVVRETTAACVSSIAERLVRDEIDRIKAAIKKL